MQTVNSIFKLCLGISAILLSAAAFNFSTQPAHAAPPATKAFVEDGNNSGKYMISYAAAPGQGDKTRWSAILVNTETGRGHIYFDESSSKPYFSVSGSDAW